MKVIPMFCSILLTCATLYTAAGQSTRPEGNDAKPGYCDEVIPATKARLQADADGNCSTVHASFECVERKSGEALYATLVVQPKNPTCKKAVKDIQTLDEPASRGADKAAAAAAVPYFKVEILQSPCFGSGSNFQVFIPGYGSDSNQFSYLWEVDGKKAGHMSSIQCACGKQAKVRVTQLATGVGVTKLIRLFDCNSRE